MWEKPAVDGILAPLLIRRGPLLSAGMSNAREAAGHTRRRLGGRHPLCGTGV
jgi:hypothetical protein